MTFLKYLMLFMIALVVVVLIIVGYFFFTAKVTVADCESTGRAAITQADLFAQVQQYMNLGAFPGVIFSDVGIGDAADYAFITYTLELSNQCLVPVDMIEIQIIPEDGDMLQLGDFEVHSLEPKSSGSVSATILTQKDSHSVREVVITYYVWGVSFSIRTTCG
ncbi:MAG: hypothetical protein IH607_00430 [Firmicutes bacterium]|nr:hypothetical protein [Bacillota bacterium]